MTYRELLKLLAEMSEEILDQNVTVFDSESKEYYPMVKYSVTKEDDVLDKGHLFLSYDR
jgi:hypothetical protein